MKNMQVLKKELIEKAMHCKNAEELMALARSEGITLTKEEAEAYLAETPTILPGSIASRAILRWLCQVALSS